MRWPWLHRRIVEEMPEAVIGWVSRLARVRPDRLGPSPRRSRVRVDRPHHERVDRRPVRRCGRLPGAPRSHLIAATKTTGSLRVFGKAVQSARASRANLLVPRAHSHRADHWRRLSSPRSTRTSPSGVGPRPCETPARHAHCRGNAAALGGRAPGPLLEGRPPTRSSELGSRSMRT